MTYKWDFLPTSAARSSSGNGESTRRFSSFAVKYSSKRWSWFWNTGLNYRMGWVDFDTSVPPFCAAASAKSFGQSIQVKSRRLTSIWDTLYIQGLWITSQHVIGWETSRKAYLNSAPFPVGGDFADEASQTLHAAPFCLCFFCMDGWQVNATVGVFLNCISRTKVIGALHVLIHSWSVSILLAKVNTRSTSSSSALPPSPSPPTSSSSDLLKRVAVP